MKHVFVFKEIGNVFIQFVGFSVFSRASKILTRKQVLTEDFLYRSVAFRCNPALSAVLFGKSFLQVFKTTPSLNIVLKFI